MTIVNGRAYRFINVYHNGYGLNIYGTGASDIKGGQNVCLYSESPTDSMQQWEIEERGSNGYRLHAVPKPSYVLDCSDGSISTSYKNNAHMCAGTGTTDADCAVEFEYVGGNQVRIHLGQKGLCLTATTVAESDAELSNNISTSAALRGGSEGRGNVYWKTPADEGSLTWKKQCWEVIEVGGGTDPEPEPGTKMTLADLMQKFPNGKYWNHVGMSDNNQDGYTNTPCPSHGEDNTNLLTCNCYKLNGMVKAWQCQGFVMKCGYDAYGSDPYTWSQITGSNALNNLKPGDIVRYYINGIDDDNLHSIFVTSVSGDTITFGDCNADLQCGIRWGAQTTKQKLQLKPVKLVYSAPFELK